MLARRANDEIGSRHPAAHWGDVPPPPRSADPVTANLECSNAKDIGRWRRAWQAFRFRAEGGRNTSVESMAPRTGQAIPTNTNLLLTVLCVFLNLYQYFVLPLVLLPLGGAWALTLIPVALATTTYWAVLHEAFHGQLHPRRSVNAAAGRIMGILFGAPFHVLRFGHLTHHRLNGTPTDRSEVHDPARTSRLRAALVYYPRLFFGLYGTELLSTVLAFLPRPLLRRVVRRIFYEGHAEAQEVPDRAVDHLAEGARLWQIRLDSMVILAIFGLSAVCYGADWPLLVLVLCARGLMISFLDNAFHYGTPLGDVMSSCNLWLPNALSRLMLNFNLHRVHHRHPSLPWSALHRTFAAEDEKYDGGLLPVMLRQLHGPIPAYAVAGEKHEKDQKSCRKSP